MLGLPDIQRPFVWNTIKVRDLFDSMFKGYPVGYLLLWEAPKNSGRKQIGTEMHGQDTPSTLIIDGQQRLTSLYSVMKDKPVLTKKFIEKKLAISFRPLTAEFGVTSAAHKRSPEWIDDISVLFTQSEATRRITNSFISKLSETKELSDAEEDSISTNIEKLLSLKKFPFTALEVNATTSEEDVADIFVRVNSRGQNLNQADFVLTLISVFWGREENNLKSSASQPEKEICLELLHLII